MTNKVRDQGIIVTSDLKLADPWTAAALKARVRKWDWGQLPHAVSERYSYSCTKLLWKPTPSTKRRVDRPLKKDAPAQNKFGSWQRVDGQEGQFNRLTVKWDFYFWTRGLEEKYSGLLWSWMGCQVTTHHAYFIEKQIFVGVITKNWGPGYW